MITDNGGKNTRKLVGPLTGSSRYIVKGDDDILLCDSTDGAIEIVLPNIYTSGFLFNSKRYFITDVSGTAATNNITISAGGSDQVNGENNIVISVNKASLECLIASKGKWLVQGEGLEAVATVDWKTTGNSLTGASATTPNEWMGSSNDYDVVFKRNGSESMRIGASGVGFGVTDPTATVHVGGTFRYVDGNQASGYVLTSDTDGYATWQPGSTAPTNELAPVISQTNTPAVGPSTGDRYLINTAPTGVWVGHKNQIAEWDGAAWTYTIPVLDDTVFVTATLTTKRYNGTAWVNYAGTALLQNGNSLTSAVIAGSNNAQAFQFKTNNAVRAQFTSAGQYNVANNMVVGNISLAASARFHLRAASAAAGAYSVKIENSTPAINFLIANNGYITNSSIIDTTTWYIANKFSGDNTLKVQADSAGRGFIVTENSNITSGNGIQFVVTNAGVRSIRGMSNSASATIANLNFESTAVGIGSTVFTPVSQLHVANSTNGLLVGTTSAGSLANTAAFGLGSTYSVIGFKEGQDVGTTSSWLWNLREDGGAGNLGLWNTGVILAMINAKTGTALSRFELKTDAGSSTFSIQGDDGTLRQSGDSYFGYALGSARVHITGVDTTALNYALKIDDSSHSTFVAARNDGFFGIGVITPSAGSPKLEVRGNILVGPGTASASAIDAPISIARTNAGSPNYYSGFQIAWEVGGGGWGIGMNYVQNAYQFLGSTATRFTFGGGTSSSPENTFIMDGNGGFLAINKPAYDYTANLHVKNLSLGTQLVIKAENVSGTSLFSVQNDGDVAIGLNTASAKLHIQGTDATTNINTRFEPVAGATEDILGNTVTTTNNTPTTIQTIAIPNNSTVLLVINVVCRKTAGAGVGTVGDGNGYVRTVKIKNVSGTVTSGTFQSSYTQEDITSFDVSISISGTNILLQVTGNTNDTVKWNSIVHVNTVN